MHSCLSTLNFSLYTYYVYCVLFVHFHRSHVKFKMHFPQEAGIYHGLISRVFIYSGAGCRSQPTKGCHSHHARTVENRYTPKYMLEIELITRAMRYWICGVVVLCVERRAPRKLSHQSVCAREIDRGKQRGKRSDTHTHMHCYIQRSDDSQ